MIPRYAIKEIIDIFSDKNKTDNWQTVELATLQAMEKFSLVKWEACLRIHKTLLSTPIDLEWWKKRDQEIKHDYNAFVEERRRFLEEADRSLLHRMTTTYDGEEPAMSLMLKEAVKIVITELDVFIKMLWEKALFYQYTYMMANTHGQAAELQSFGRNILTWINDLLLIREYILFKAKNLNYSKISGAVGNYTTIDPQIEKEALKILGLKPYYGATQIMPRIIHAELAQSLSNLVSDLDKIALEIRLGARSGLPIYQEPFSKIQKGSSAMPHKRNTIKTEQIGGMNRLAVGNMIALTGDIVTWECRAIEQSCVERIAFPDLFHIVVHSLRSMHKVINGLNVYPDNMLLGILNTRGCYASNGAKEKLAEMGFEAEEAYRIVQLAAFNAFEPMEKMKSFREQVRCTDQDANNAFVNFIKDTALQKPEQKNIFDIITEGKLKFSDKLDHGRLGINKWNRRLKEIFSNEKNVLQFNEVFQPSYLLRNEPKIFTETLKKLRKKGMV